MPAKGRRVASRQAELGRRRRRQAGSRPEDEHVVAAATTTPVADSDAAPAAEGSGETVATQTRPEASAAPTPAPVRGRNQPTGRVTAEVPLAYSHLGKELRRIFIMAGILTIVLIVLSILI
jgi:hypothetical protein